MNKMKKYSTEEFAKSMVGLYEEIMERQPIFMQRISNEAKKINHLFHV